MVYTWNSLNKAFLDANITYFIWSNVWYTYLCLGYCLWNLYVNIPMAPMCTVRLHASKSFGLALKADQTCIFPIDSCESASTFCFDYLLGSDYDVTAGTFGTSCNSWITDRGVVVVHVAAVGHEGRCGSTDEGISRILQRLVTKADKSFDIHWPGHQRPGISWCKTGTGYLTTCFEYDQGWGTLHGRAEELS